MKRLLLVFFVLFGVRECQPVPTVGAVHLSPRTVSSCWGVINRVPNPDSGTVGCDGGSGYVQAKGTCWNGVPSPFAAYTTRYGTVQYRVSGTPETRASVSCTSFYPVMTGVVASTWGS